MLRRRVYSASASMVSAGVSSGASVPEMYVEGVVEALRGMGYTDMESVETTKENMHFVLPAELRRQTVR